MACYWNLKMNTTLIQPGDVIQTKLLNNAQLSLYSYINNINYTVYPEGVPATTTVSGAILFTNTIGTSTIDGLFPAISPFSLFQNIENGPMALNTYYGNTISNNVSYLNASMYYILLPNKVIMIFGQCTPSITTYTVTIHLSQLFALTPYTLSTLYFINIAGGETFNLVDLSPALIYMSKDIVLTNIIVTTGSVSWFALGVIN
jgi:hypothetical protein